MFHNKGKRGKVGHWGRRGIQLPVSGGCAGRRLLVGERGLDRLPRLFPFLFPLLFPLYTYIYTYKFVFFSPLGFFLLVVLLSRGWFTFLLSTHLLVSAFATRSHSLGRFFSRFFVFVFWGLLRVLRFCLCFCVFVFYFSFFRDDAT